MQHHAHDLLPLDPKIRDWVLLPMFALSVLVGIGRQYATQATASSTPPKADEDTHRSKQILGRAARLRAHAGVLSASAFEARKALFNSKRSGFLRAKKDDAPPPNPLQDPSVMGNMMKQQMIMMVPNMGMMAFVSYFFSGFVLCKVPFPLTSGFREMLQRGVALTTLDVSYVSSLSVYFLVMFGLSGFFGVLLGGPGISMGDDLQAQMGMLGAQQQQQQPFQKQAAFASERDSLELVHHRWQVGRAAERKLVGG